MADPTYTLPSVDELTELATAYHSNLLPDDDVSRGSDEWARNRVLALVGADINLNSGNQLADAMPDSATNAAADRWGAVVNRTRQGATVVTGAAALRVRGTVGEAYSIGDTLTHAGGAQFEITSAGVIPAGGYADVDISSITKGSSARLTAGQKLAFDSTPTGLEQNAEILFDLVDGGEDAELDPVYRPRYLDAFARRDLGNTVADWENWVREAGVSAIAAFVFRGRAGLGTIDLAAFKAGSGDARSLTTGERATLLAYVEARHPATATPRVLETVATEADVRIHVEPLPGAQYGSDWKTDGHDFEVVTFNPTTRVLQLDADRPPSLKRGHRLVIDVGTGESAVVEELGPGTDEVTIRAPYPAALDTLGGSERVWPGGPLTEPIRAAVKAHVDTLGPRLGSYGSGWQGALTRTDVLVAAKVAGVLNSDCFQISGAAFATIEALNYLFPDDDQVGYLKAGRILVIYTSTL